MAEGTRALFARDFLFEVMKDSQRMRAGYLAEREHWLRTLAIDGREEVLFEFEMLLRALERYFNVHNLPLEPKADVLTRDFGGELRAVREAIGRATQLTRLLLDPPSDRNLVFRKFLETTIADDRSRGQLLEEELSQVTPQESLFLLRSGFAALGGIIDALLELPNTPYRRFSDVGQLIVREVALNKYFRPFRPLEFRVEYDRLKSVRILEILRRDLVRGPDAEEVRRELSVAFLALYRLLHYLRYVPVVPNESRLRGGLILALVHSESTSLASFLETELSMALDRLGRGYATGAKKLASEIRKELSKVYKRHLVGANTSDPEVLGRSRETLEDLLKQWVASLARLFEPELEGKEIFDDYVSRREQARRLRQDLWAFRAICKQVEKESKKDDAEASAAVVRVLRRYVDYFRDVSYQLLRYADYTQFDRFIQIVGEIGPPKLEQPRGRKQLREDCHAFTQVLTATFDSVSKREELSSQPFSEREAQKLVDEMAKAVA